MATSKTAASTAVTKKEAALPAVAFDYGTDAGAGFENTSGKDLSIPFISILQSNSPQVEDENPKGSKPGMLFNTVTRELIEGEDGLVFLPAHHEEAFVEWKPRDAGGGFVGMHDENSEEVQNAIKAKGTKFAKLTSSAGNDLIQTKYMYGLLLNKEGTESLGFAVISFTSTKIKPFTDWLTSMYTLKGKPPLFANRAVLKTVKQKNEKGTFYNFQIEPFGENWSKGLINPVEEGALLSEGKDFRQMVISGMARASFETQNSTAGAGGEATSEDAPF